MASILNPFVPSFVLLLHVTLINADSGALVLDPIPTKDLTSADVDELARTTRDLMLRELAALSEKAQGRPMAMPADLNTPVKASGVDTTVGSL